MKIGKYSSISARCCIGRSNHPSNWLSTSEFQFRNSHNSRFESLEDEDLKEWDSTKRTTIGNDVWIGDSAEFVILYSFLLERTLDYPFL